MTRHEGEPRLRELVHRRLGERRRQPRRTGRHLPRRVRVRAGVRTGGRRALHGPLPGAPPSGECLGAPLARGRRAPRGRAGVGGRARHAGDLRRLRRRRDHQRRAQRPLRVLLLAALAPRLVLRLRRRWSASSPHAGFRDVAGDRSAGVGAGLLEGRSRSALAVRGARRFRARRIRPVAFAGAGRGSTRGRRTLSRSASTNSCCTASTSCAPRSRRSRPRPRATPSPAVVALVPAVLAIPTPFDPAWPDVSLFDRLPRRSSRSRAGCSPKAAASAAWRASASTARSARDYVEQVHHEWVPRRASPAGTPRYVPWRRRHAAGPGAP